MNKGGSDQMHVVQGGSLRQMYPSHFSPIQVRSALPVFLSLYPGEYIHFTGVTLQWQRSFFDALTMPSGKGRNKGPRPIRACHEVPFTGHQHMETSGSSHATFSTDVLLSRQDWLLFTPLVTTRLVHDHEDGR